jgi:hypothetical protein
MDFDAGAAAPPAADFTPAAPVEAPEAPAAPAEVEAPKAPAAPASKDEFEKPDAGAEDAKRTAARDPKDGMDTIQNSLMCRVYERFKSGEWIQPKTPILYQGPGAFTPVPREDTHVGITEDTGIDAGFNRNFVNYTAAANANTDSKEYDNNPAHAYEHDREGTLKRAEDLGTKMEEWTSKYDASKNSRDREIASRGMATTYGQYLHMLQDNRAHGGTDSAEHYGAKVDQNPDAIKMARADTKTAWTDLKTYFDSRKVPTMGINPGPTPPYGLPPWSALKEACEAPKWDGTPRMWPRDEMSTEIQNRFNGRLRYGPSVPL